MAGRGPLDGVRIVEMSGIGPAPFCAMLLADLGADVIRIDRLQAVDLGFNTPAKFDLLNRGKRAAAVDLKSAAGIGVVKTLVAQADALIEGYRPGVMERLGLGPDVCLGINPRLIYGRMTGYGQSGPMRDLAGHDINYIAMSGALAACGTSDQPVPPLNLVGDFAGGSMYLAMGLLAALIETKASGKGQVVDAAMVDGVGSLMAMVTGLRQAGLWRNTREDNVVDGGAPYYRTYRTADGKFMAVGAIEARFYAALINGLGLAAEQLPKQNDKTHWPAMHRRFAEIFASRTRDEWTSVFAGTDACVTPVLDMVECVDHPLNSARSNYVEIDGVVGPTPAPKFSRTPGKVAGGTVEPRADTVSALTAWGLNPSDIEELAASGVIAA